MEWIWVILWFLAETAHRELGRKQKRTIGFTIDELGMPENLSNLPVSEDDGCPIEWKTNRDGTAAPE